MTVMAETSFEVKYDGDALREGRMPVRDLAPALLALGQLFTEASQLLFPENDPVSLEIEATREGSFEVELILHGAGMGWDQLSTHPVATAATLVVFKEVVIGDSIDLSLFGLLKWLKGKLITEQKEGPEPGQVTLRAEDGLEITVQAEVAALSTDPGIRRKAREVVEPLRRDGVDSLEFRSDEKPTVTLEKEDVPAFELPEAEDAEVVSQQEIDIFLDVFSPDLEKGGTRKWRFGGLGETFMAPIEDPEFMEKVSQHEEVFGAGDQLRARLQIIQKRDPVSGKVRAERKVVKVYECIKALEQLSLQERAEQVQKQLGKGDDESPPPALPSAS
jgi:hypothetical protein